MYPRILAAAITAAVFVTGCNTAPPTDTAPPSSTAAGSDVVTTDTPTLRASSEGLPPDPDPDPVCATVLGAIQDMAAAASKLAPFDADLSNRAKAIQQTIEQREYESPNRCAADYSQPCAAIPLLGADVLSSAGGNTDMTEADALAITAKLEDAFTLLHTITSHGCTRP